MYSFIEFNKICDFKIKIKDNNPVFVFDTAELLVEKVPWLNSLKAETTVNCKIDISDVSVELFAHILYRGFDFYYIDLNKL